MVTEARVLVVGAGISGAACAARLRAAGIAVTVRERGRSPGGRLAAPTLHGRRVDLGAAYFTVADDDFARVVDGWRARGLARPWTDTFDVAGGEAKTGPVRWAAHRGLRSLVRDLHGEIACASPVVTAPDPGFDVTVLAMPDPQAQRLAGNAAIDWVDYEPVIAVAAGWSRRAWPIADAAFVNDDPDVTLVVDDGARRGDGAAVLVAHTTAGLARRQLRAPGGAVAPVLAALRRALGITPTPEWTHAHRWTYAKPGGTHGDAPFALDDALGVCGDSWCPSGSPRVESAWLSGDRLGAELVRRLSGTRAS